MLRLSFFKNGTLLGVLIAGSCFVNSVQAQFGKGPALPTRSTVVAGVAGEAVPITRKKYVGNVEAIEEVDAIARVEGFLTVAPDFVEGMHVKKGQLLFTIEPIQYQARVDSAKAEIKQLEAQIDYANKNFKRVNELYSRQAGSKNDMENAESNLLSLQAKLLAAKAQLVLAETELSYTQIEAQIDGRAGRRAYSTGNYVSSSSDPLVKIVQTDPIYVRFTMSERDYLSMFKSVDDLKDHSELQLTLPDSTTYPLEGKISFIDNTVKSTTDTIKVWATFSNPNETLRPGGVVTVNLAKYETENSATVEPSAVMFDGEKNYVYILVDSLTDEQLYQEIKADNRFAKNIVAMEAALEAAISGNDAISEFLEQYKDNMIVAQSIDKISEGLNSDKAALATIELAASLAQMKTFEGESITKDPAAVLTKVKNGGLEIWIQEYLSGFKTQRYVYDNPQTKEKQNDFANNKVNDKFMMVLRRDVTLGPAGKNIETISSGIKPNQIVMMDGVHKARPFDLVIPVYRDKKQNDNAQVKKNDASPAQEVKEKNKSVSFNKSQDSKRVDAKKKLALKESKGDSAA